MVVCKEYIVCLALSDTDGKQFQGLKDKLKDAPLFGKDINPSMREEILKMTNNYNDKVSKIRTNRVRQERAFMHKEADNGVKRNSCGGKSECFQCGKDGHCAHEYPSITTEQRTKGQKED